MASGATMVIANISAMILNGHFDFHINLREVNICFFAKRGGNDIQTLMPLKFELMIA